MKTPAIIRDFKVDLVEMFHDVGEAMQYVAISFKERILHGMTLHYKVKDLQEYFVRAHAETGRYGYGFYNQRMAEVGYLCDSYPDLARKFERTFATVDKDLLICGLAKEFKGVQAHEFVKAAQDYPPVDIAVIYFNTLEKLARKKASALKSAAMQSALAEAEYITLRLKAKHEDSQNNFLKYGSAVGKYLPYLWAAFFLLHSVGEGASWLVGADMATVIATLMLYSVDLYNKPTVIKVPGNIYELKSFDDMLNSSQLSSVHLKWFIAQSHVN